MLLKFMQYSFSPKELRSGLQFQWVVSGAKIQRRIPVGDVLSDDLPCRQDHPEVTRSLLDRIPLQKLNYPSKVKIADIYTFLNTRLSLSCITSFLLNLYFSITSGLVCSYILYHSFSSRQIFSSDTTNSSHFSKS